MNDAQPAKWWWVVWSIGLISTTAGLVVTTFFAAVFMKPHAFGARDGQGAAGLAALILLVGAAVAVVSLVVLLVATTRVRRRGARSWLWPVSAGVPLVFAVLAFVLGAFA